MRSQTILAWYRVHRWTSLVCTIFLLFLCVTGLPLIFSGEIAALSEDAKPALLSVKPVSLGQLTAEAKSLYPNDVITSIYLEDDNSEAYVWMAPSFSAVKDSNNALHFLRFDRNSGSLLERSQQWGDRPPTLIAFLIRLHRELLMGLPGKFFLASMAVVFMVAVVSGIVIYGPYTRKLNFGVVRRGRGARIRWLDLHNLLGITTLAWALVVGATGVMNELSTPLFAFWQRTSVQQMLASQRGLPPLSENELASPQAALDAVNRAFPSRSVTSIGYPTPLDDGSPHHFFIWTKGSTALTSRLFTPILVDGKAAKVSIVIEMPWYLRALEVSRPLHFGDYGGLPLKMLWALLDLTTIVVLGSGLYLWFRKRKRPAIDTGKPSPTGEPLPDYLEAAE